jgi:hypothetical protein
MKKNLRNFIDQENTMRRMFKDKLATVPTCLEDSQWIIDSLSSKVSPENLHCDGEISNEEAQAKYDFYMLVQAELEELIGTSIELIY